MSDLGANDGFSTIQGLRTGVQHIDGHMDVSAGAVSVYIAASVVGSDILRRNELPLNTFN